MLMNLLGLLFVFGLLLIIGVSIINVYFYFKDRMMYKQFRDYAGKCEEIHFPNLSNVSTNFNYSFYNCSDLRKGKNETKEVKKNFKTI